MSGQAQRKPSMAELQEELDRRVEEVIQNYIRERTQDLSVPEQLEVERNIARGREIARRHLRENFSDS